MPILSVVFDGGDQVVADIFVEVDGSFEELAKAATAALSVTTSWCVLLSPVGSHMPHIADPVR